MVFNLFLFVTVSVFLTDLPDETRVYIPRLPPLDQFRSDFRLNRLVQGSLAVGVLGVDVDADSARVVVLMLSQDLDSPGVTPGSGEMQRGLSQPVFIVKLEKSNVNSVQEHPEAVEVSGVAGVVNGSVIGLVRGIDW